MDSSKFIPSKNVMNTDESSDGNVIVDGNSCNGNINTNKHSSGGSGGSGGSVASGGISSGDDFDPSHCNDLSDADADDESDLDYEYGSVKAVGFIQSAIRSSILDPFTNYKVQVLVMPSSSESTLSSSATPTTPTTTTTTTTTGASLTLSNDYISKILNCIKTIIIGMLSYHECDDSSIGSNGIRSNDDLQEKLEIIRHIFQLLINTIGNGNLQLYTFLAKKILPLLKKGNDVTCTTATTIDDDRIKDRQDPTEPIESKGINELHEIDNTTHNHNHNHKTIEIILEVVLDIVPLVIPHDLLSTTEDELIYLVQKCCTLPTAMSMTMSTGTGDMDTKEVIKKKNVTPTLDVTPTKKQKHGDDNRVELAAQEHEHEHDQNNNDKDQIPPSLSIRSVKSMINVFQRYHFQNKQLVLQVICDLINIISIPRMKVYDYTSTTTHNNDKKDSKREEMKMKKNELLKSMCHVLFIYLGHDDRKKGNNNGNNDSNDSNINSTKYSGSKSSNNSNNNKNTEKGDNNQNDEKMTIHVLEIIRAMFHKSNKDKQCPHQDHEQKYDFHTIEDDISKDLISFITKSNLFASGYKSLIMRTFVEKKEKMNINYNMNQNKKWRGKGDSNTDFGINTNTNSNSNANSTNRKNRWIKMDLYAFLIIYHCHPCHRKDMRQVIDDLCHQGSFPFKEIQDLLIGTTDKDGKDFVTILDRSQTSSTTSATLISSALVEIGLYLLLAPIRNPDYPRDDDSSYFSSILSGRNGSTNNHTCLFTKERILHPRRRLLFETQSLIERVHYFLSTQQQQDLINSLLRLSSHTTLIPTMLNSNAQNEPTDDKFHRTNDRKKRRQTMNNFLPYNLNRFVSTCKSNTKVKLEIRHVYDVSMTALRAIHSIVCDSSSSCGLDLRETRKIILDRLHQQVITSHWDYLLMENYNMASLDVVSKDEIETFNFTMVDNYCSILVMLSSQGSDNEQRLKEYKEMKQLFHKLLFASTYSLNTFRSRSTPMLYMNRKHCQRNAVVIGIILGKSLIQSPTIKNGEQESILQSVLNALLPPISTRDVGANPNRDPVIGYWGLSFFCSLCPEIDGQRDICIVNRASERMIDTRCSYSVSAIFKHVKTMVSRSGIVQLESEVLIRNKQNGPKATSMLAYQNPPSCFRNTSKQKRKMVYCISTLLNDIDLTTTSSGNLGLKTIKWTRYIHALIDVYLRMGRFVSPKWSADTWLCASIELPPYHIGSSVDASGSELLSHLSGKHFVAEEAKDRSSSEISTKRAISYILSIALLRAVLTNAHEHHSHNLTASLSTSGRAQNMMQFVLAKMYDLRMRYQQFMNFRQDEVHRRLELDSKILSNYDDLRIIAFHIFEETHFVPFSILWTCVKGKINAWNNIVSRVPQQNINGEQLFAILDHTTKENLVSELWLKKLILEDMIDQSCVILHVDKMYLEKQKHRGKLSSEISLDEEGMRIILQITMDIVMWLRPIYEVEETQENHNEGLIPTTVLLEQIGHFLSESLDFLQFTVERFFSVNCKNDLVWLVPYSSTKKLCTDLIQVTFHIGDPFLSSKILDFVSLLSICNNTFVEELSTANWKQFLLIKSKPTEEIFAKLPHSFAHLLNRHLVKSCVLSSDVINKPEVLLHLLRTVSNSSFDNCKDILLQHHLLAHWATAISHGSTFCQEYDTLIDCLRILIKQLASDVMMDTKSQGKESRNIPIQSLCIRTIPMIYELLLNMSITSFILNISEEDNHLNASLDNWGEPITSPVPTEDWNQLLQVSAKLVKIFGSVIELYTSNFKLFPMGTLDITIRASSLMIKSCEVQIKTSLKWKAATLQSTPRKKGTKRADAVYRLLKPTFDYIQTYARLILNFCNTIPDSIADDEEVQEASLKNRKRIISLVARCERILSSLHEINGAYNYLLPSSLESLREYETSPSIRYDNKSPSKMQRRSPKQSNQNAAHSRISRSKNTLRTKRRRDSPHNNQNNQVLLQDLHLETAEDKSDNDDSDSFGVMGDWGKEMV